MSRAVVAVDIGNSSVKAGIFTDLSTRPFPAPEAVTEYEPGSPPEHLRSFLPDEPVHWRVATVHRDAEERLAAWVRHNRVSDDYRRLIARDLPLTVQVDYPDRVGMDRLAAAVAVNAVRLPHSPAIVVDAGTAITVDLVDANGSFQGGVILPGMRITAAALAEKTDLLPLVDPQLGQGAPPVLGKSTESAIRSGLFWGAVGAVKEVVARLSQDSTTPPQLFLTGGGAGQLVRWVRADGVFVPHLVLSGILLAAQCLVIDQRGILRNGE